MRVLALIFILILSSCKTEQTSTTPEEMWKNYTASYSEFTSDEMPEAEYFHDNKEDAKRLADLILNNKKKAGSSPYFFYEKYNADLPKVGNKQIVTDFDGKARAIIQTTKVDTIPFNKISREYAALDMGTNTEPLKKWKEAHWSFFKNALEEIGAQPTEDMLVVCVWFETIWPENN